MPTSLTGTHSAIAPSLLQPIGRLLRRGTEVRPALRPSNRFPPTLQNLFLFNFSPPRRPALRLTNPSSLMFTSTDCLSCPAVRPSLLLMFMVKHFWKLLIWVLTLSNCSAACQSPSLKMSPIVTSISSSPMLSTPWPKTIRQTVFAPFLPKRKSLLKTMLF